MKKAYFEIPKDTIKKSPKGSAPKLVDHLIQQFHDAIEIKISFFLYNNPFIHAALEKLTEQGCRVVVYTIPLEGYDKTRKKITFSRGNTEWISKYDYALKIRQRITEEKSSIELRYFPHTNIWYEQKTSRGSDSYALHNKSILIKYRDGSYRCVSSSSNFALGDPPHSENMYISDEKEDVSMFLTYFNLLHKNSYSLNEYTKFSQKNFDFEHITVPINMKGTFHTCYFTAPYIKYGGVGSNHYVQSKIIDFIKNAREKLYFCFQHISDIDSFDKEADSIIEIIGLVAKHNPKLDIKLMKQTRASDQKQGGRTKKSEDYLKKFNQIQQRALYPVVHDKFIIADQNLLVTTANLTSTQFAWAENYLMKYKEKEEEYDIINTFSDINSFHFIYNDRIVNEYLEHFNLLWDDANSVGINTLAINTWYFDEDIWVEKNKPFNY